MESGLLLFACLEVVCFHVTCLAQLNADTIRRPVERKCNLSDHDARDAARTKGTKNSIGELFSRSPRAQAYKPATADGGRKLIVPCACSETWYSLNPYRGRCRGKLPLVVFCRQIGRACNSCTAAHPLTQLSVT